VAIGIFKDGDGRIIVVEYRIEIRLSADSGFQAYVPLAGDAETRRMMALCAEGKLPPAILADRIDEVEPADRPRPYENFTALLRSPGLEMI
jgi:hypothetical protein